LKGGFWGGIVWEIVGGEFYCVLGGGALGGFQWGLLIGRRGELGWIIWEGVVGVVGVVGIMIIF